MELVFRNMKAEKFFVNIEISTKMLKLKIERIKDYHTKHVVPKV